MTTRKVKVGAVSIGQGAPVSVQSMTNCSTNDIDKAINQINTLEAAGCEIVRLGVPDEKSVKALKEISENTNLPLVADIHFDHRLAIEASKYVQKLRINPGNIGNDEKIKQVVDAAKEHDIPIRIGVNLGSLEKDLEAKYGLSAKAMVESAKKHILILEKHNFYDTVVSLKASDVLTMIEANRMFSKDFDYPLHVGVTEAGSVFSGSINNAIGIGCLLDEGIGDTLRVSLAGDPVDEVRAGWQILKAMGIRQRGVKVIACPTCARAGINVASIAKEIEKKTADFKEPIKVAIMGCGVNGPGEARHADIGVVGGSSNLLYVKGEKVGNIEEKDIVSKVINLITTI